MKGQKMERHFCLVFIYIIFFDVSNAMTRQQLKNSGKLMKKICIPKNDVTEDEVGEIENGKFIETRNVMCYVACIYGITQVRLAPASHECDVDTNMVIKNNKLNYEAFLRQVDVMFPAEMRVAVKAAITSCKDVQKNYKDLCEASFWTAKCIYTADPKNFVFA